MPCNITGIARLPSGAVLANTKIVFKKLSGVGSLVDGAETPVVFPVDETVYTDATGAVDFDLYYGSYRGTAYPSGSAPEDFAFGVPDAATAVFGACVNLMPELSADLVTGSAIQKLEDAAQPYVSLSQKWAEGTQPDGAGTFSSKEWSETSQKWAANPEDTEVSSGLYSALHYAAKASGSSDLSAAWAEGTEPGGAGTKSAKEWADYVYGISQTTTVYFKSVSDLYADTSLSYASASGKIQVSDGQIIPVEDYFVRVRVNGVSDADLVTPGGVYLSFYFPPQRKGRRGLRALIDAAEPLNRIRKDVVIEKRRSDYVELAVYSALDSAGVDFARWWASNRFTSGNAGTGAIDIGFSTLAKLYSSTVTALFGAQRTVTSTPTNTYATTDATSRTGTWTGSATVGGVTDINYSSVPGDSTSYDVTVPAGGIIYARGYAASNGAYANVTVDLSGTEITSAEYLGADDGAGNRLVRYNSGATGIIFCPVAKVVSAGTYTVTLTHADISGDRLYDGGVYVTNAIPFDEVGVHGVSLVSTSGGETSDWVFDPGATLVYQIDNATRVSFEYYQSTVNGIADLTLYDTSGSIVASASVDMNGAAGNLSYTVAADLPKGTYYLHAMLSDQTTSGQWRMYAHAPIGYDATSPGVIGVDAFDILSMSSNPVTAYAGTHQIAGPGNWTYATQWRSPGSVDGDEEFVGGVHQFETNLTNAALAVKVDGASVAWDAAAVGDTFAGSSIELDFTTRLYFPTPVVGDGHTLAITGITQAANAVVTAAGHGLVTGDEVLISGVSGMTEINKRTSKVTVLTADTFSLDTVNSSAFSGYGSGGYVHLPFATLSRVFKFTRGALMTQETNLTLIADAIQATAYPLMLQCPNSGTTLCDDTGGGFDICCADRGGNYFLGNSDGSTVTLDQWNELFAFYNREYAVYGEILNADELLATYASLLTGRGNAVLRDNTSDLAKAYTVIGGGSQSTGFSERVVKAYRIVPTSEAELLFAS